MSERIRVSDDTYAALSSLKREDETFDALLTRLLSDRCVQIREGAGLWEGTDAAEGARQTRQELKGNLGDQ